MPATVPLSSPVKTVTSARALAESIATADADAPVGPAIDRILRFFDDLPYLALVDHTESVLDVLHLLATERALHATAWLSEHAGDLDTACYWAQLHELTFLGRAA